MSTRLTRASLLVAALAACSGAGGGTGGSTAATDPAPETTADDVGEAAPGTSPDDPTGGAPTGPPTSASATDGPGTATTVPATESDPSSPGTTGPDPTSPGTTEPDPTAPGTTTDPGDTGDVPPLDGAACHGYATRYWDCCKAHCGWQGNVHAGTTPIESCDKADQSHGPVYDVASACQAPAEDSAFTCYSGAPWAVSASLAYGFAAVPAQGDICGRCYQLEFDGTGHYNAQDPGSVALSGKAMIVQATNIGHDVAGGQFDILTPGGGVGLFDACSYQWGVETAELGATYGGFMTHCQQQHPGDHAQQKQCVLGRCAAVFDDPGLAELAAGCEWYVEWYEAADNPNLRFQEVACPPALVAVSGIDRGPLDDITPCMGGGGRCSQEEMDACDCGWTNGGQNCGQDDGSCCWGACCD